MHHFHGVSDAVVSQLFQVRPQSVVVAGATEPSDRMAWALGATLYTPGTHPRLADVLRRNHRRGVASSVLCLEDSIADVAVVAAQSAVVTALVELNDEVLRPWVFVRVRHADQLLRVAEELGSRSAALTGFVLPKFGADSQEFLDAAAKASEVVGRHLWVLPVIEAPRVTHIESRVRHLLEVRSLLDAHRSSVLAVRLGLVDVAAEFGIRRSRAYTAYDVPVLAGFLEQVTNVFARETGRPYIVTGGVWEHLPSQRQLTRTPPSQAGRVERSEWSAELLADLDGLVRECRLDLLSGLGGKSVIHPMHVPVVNALHVVSHEDYADACAVSGAARQGLGVSVSPIGNKMNEPSPHRPWAERTLARASVFGVAAAGTTLPDLVAAAAHE